MADVLLTLDEVAARLHRSPKTLRRMLPALMAAHSHLTVIRVGRSIMLRPDQFATLMKVLEWRSHTGGAVASGIAAAQSALAARRSPSLSSAQDAVRELTQRLRARPRKPASELNTLRVLPGGRSA